MKVLAGGTAVQIEPFEPAAAASSVERAAVHTLIVQPAAPWFSEVERRHVEGALSGEFGAVACDHDKIEILRQVGFHHEATLAGQLKAGCDRFDLRIYTFP